MRMQRLFRPQKKMKLQAAVDFMISYGIAIIVIALALYVVARLGVFNNSLAQPTCSTAPSFACVDVAISRNGIMTFVITQATGGAINVTGAACSSGINVTGNLPQYGNTKLLSNSVAPQYYVNSALNPGIVLYSDAATAITIPCYGNFGVSSTNVGTEFSGYIWINYTYTGLPSTYHTVERVLQFTTRTS